MAATARQAALTSIPFRSPKMTVIPFSRAQDPLGLTIMPLSDPLAVLGRASTLAQAQQAHAHLLTTGFAVRPLLATKLINLYARNAALSHAALLFETIPRPDALAFASLVSAYTRATRFSDALKLFHRMVKCGLIPDHFALPSALKACAGLPAPEPARQLHLLSITLGLSCDPYVQCSLVHTYVKCNQIDDARLVFDRMREKNVVSWSAIVSGYARGGDVDEAKRLFKEMQAHGVKPNVVSWNGLVAGLAQAGLASESLRTFLEMAANGCGPDGTTISSVLPAIAELEDLVGGRQIHGYTIKLGLGFDVCVVSALLDMYGTCGKAKEMLQAFEDTPTKDVGSFNALVAGFSRNGLVDKALQVFREIEGLGMELNIISWTSMVAALAQNGRDLEALDLFREMQITGISPNSVTIPCVLPACSNIAALQHGRAVHGFSIRRKISFDIYVGSALVDMYAKCGRIMEARRVFDAMPKRNLVSWNAIVGGYAMHGQAKDAIELFDSMLERGFRPDHISFTCVLSACSQAGFLEEGWKYFHSMACEHGFEARTEHYACMVSLLGRAGRLEEAYSLITEMPTKPDTCVWGALLNSCRLHRNVKLGELAAEHLFELEPRNSGNYVLLSNIYASVGLLDGVDRVREKMKRLGLRKSPGCSWIEVKNKVHLLLAGDKSHPQMAQIIEKIESLSLEMKKAGWLPKTDFVLQDVEEQDKEQILCGHSEKLAIGFGLLNTPIGSQLRVIKNLRTCGDCHSVIKFISRFESREIFVRDTNRFHHFKDGECSCGDYW
ncbi:hypothetical protein AMTRI_Chr09g14720 [Amborella trichopoda]